MHEPQSRLVRLSSPLVWDVLLYGLLVGLVLYWRVISEANGNETTHWPTPADVRLSWPRGIGLATLLLASSTTINQALRSASHRACGSRRLGWTLGIGVLFVACQLSEVRTRIRQNLLPDPFGTGVHNRADLYYLSAVRQRLQDLATELNSASIKANLSETNTVDGDSSATVLSKKREERLAVVNRLLTAQLGWTESKVSQQSPSRVVDQRAALVSLAQDVFPIPAYSMKHRQFREREIPEMALSVAVTEGELTAANLRIADNSPLLQMKLAEVAGLNGELKAIREQLKKFPSEHDSDQDPVDQPSAQEQANATELVGRDSLVQQLEQLQPQHEVATAELTRLASLVTEAEETVARLNAQIVTTRARLQEIAEMPAVGLNEHYRWLYLPVAIPSGRRWAVAYFGLIFFHLAHVIVGLLNFIPRLVRCDRPLAMVEIVAYWHVQVVVGCVLLVLFYVV